MVKINLSKTKHDFQKQNLVTIFKGRKHYDILVCCKCGMEGKTTSLGFMEVPSSYSTKKINYCIHEPEDNTDLIGRTIQITRCMASGKAFDNLTPSSYHEIVNPPNGYKNDIDGVWVMGIGEPVKVLDTEFKYK